MTNQASNQENQMNESNLLFSKETREIIGCSFEVANTLGHGFHEKIYENALVVEFGLQNIPVIQQAEFPVAYKMTKVGSFIPDLICFDTIVVDAKTIGRITDHEIGQMLNYLKIAKKQVGLLINFKHAKLEWKRVVL
jgi:GxxExxY protein